MPIVKKVFGKCHVCKEEINNKKSLRKCPSGVYCAKCKAKKRKKERNLLHSSGIIKSREAIHEESQRKKRQRELEERNKTYEPEMKGSIIDKKKKRIFKQKTIHGSRYLSIYLTRTEKKLLYKKYINQGLLSQEASKKVMECANYLTELVRKLKEQKQEKEEIHRKFQEEFARMIEKDL